MLMDKNLKGLEMFSFGGFDFDFIFCVMGAKQTNVIFL
jgi:hypothetical protein